ncbi:MAG: hypothetical protein ACREMA_08850 [Longimicrobiales bacterium]
MRRTIETGLPIVGTVLVFAAVVLIKSLGVQIALVLLGLIIIDAGIWKLTQPLLPNQRQHYGLRMEVDNFLVLVRRLNEIATSQNEHDSPAAHAAFRDVVMALHDSVGRIERQAGKTDADLKPTEVPAGR